MKVSLKYSVIGILCFLLALSPLLGVDSHKNSVRPAQAQEEGSMLTLAGLQAPVEVIYDTYGVPHIYAENSPDLFMAQGFVHSQDRFWQMEWWRRLSAGRQAELGGNNFVGFDMFLRTLGFQGVAQADFEAASPEAQSYLQSYAEGVNAYIASKASPSELAIEFQYLAEMGIEVSPEPWTALDSLRWLRVMAFDLSGNFQDEISRALLAENAGALARIAVPYFHPEYNFEQFPAIVEPGGVPYVMEAAYVPPMDYSNVNFNLVGGVALDNLPTGIGRGTGIGSNSWVISGDLTETGSPYVVNDPHLGIQLPSIWYEVGLHCVTKTEDCPYDVVGVSFAGFPGVVIGHNDRIAWGFTNVGTDNQDLYILQTNPDNPNQYQLDGEWVDFEIREEVVGVQGGEAITVPVKVSVWGPVISDIISELGAQVVALRWTALESATLADALFGLDRATDWESFREALRLFDLPAQNVIYADVDGNIGYQMPGKTPIRAEGHDPRYPVDGSTMANAWQGYVPFEELPSVYNPESGYIVTANNSVVGPDYPYYITADWDYGYRAKRIEVMIQNDADGVLTVDDMMAIQGDNYNLKADYLIPFLETLTFEEEMLANAVVWLGEWDRQNSLDSGQALLFEMFWTELLEGIFADDFGFVPDGGSRYWYIVDQMLANPSNPVANTLWAGEPSDIVITAFADAYTRLVEMYGDDPTQWRWGAAHLANFTHELFGYDDTYADIFNVSVEAAGGGSIVNATGWGAGTAMDTGTFPVGGLPSMRQILMPMAWDNSLRINTLGQSGDPESPHYADQVEMWRTIQYRTEFFSREAVEANASMTINLVPSE